MANELYKIPLEPRTAISSPPWTSRETSFSTTPTELLPTIFSRQVEASICNCGIKHEAKILSSSLVFSFFSNKHPQKIVVLLPVRRGRHCWVPERTRWWREVVTLFWPSRAGWLKLDNNYTIHVLMNGSETKIKATKKVKNQLIEKLSHGAGKDGLIRFE